MSHAKETGKCDLSWELGEAANCSLRMTSVTDQKEIPEQRLHVSLQPERGA